MHHKFVLEKKLSKSIGSALRYNLRLEGGTSENASTYPKNYNIFPETTFQSDFLAFAFAFSRNSGWTTSLNTRTATIVAPIGAIQ